MGRANCADNAFADARDDCFFSSAPDESIKMRTHRHTRLYFYSDAILGDAEADKRVAQAKAEVRRAAAVAVEQEMRAKTQEMRAKVVEAEALVPQAMADAFRSGNLGIMDYVRMKNVQADTSMRESIAGSEKPSTS